MIFPTKHQNIKENPLVIGADILFLLRKDKKLTIEELFQELRVIGQIQLNGFYDTLTYLWLINAIEFDKGVIQKK